MKRHHAMSLTLLLALILPLTLGASQTRKEAAKNPHIKNKPVTQATDYSRYFTTPSPKGKWRAAAASDSEQISDGDSPVVVSGVESLLGQGKSANLIVKQVILENRTQLTVKRIALKWALTDDEAQRSVVLQGDTSAFEVMLPSFAQQTAEIPVLDFAKIARPLMKGEALYGNFLLKLRVSEITFADGSSWQYEAATKFIKAGLYTLPAIAQDNCPNNGCGTATDTGQAQCGWYVSGVSNCSIVPPCTTGTNGVRYCVCQNNWCSSGGFQPPRGPRPDR